MSERVPDERFNAATPEEKFSWMYAEAARARAEVEKLTAERDRYRQALEDVFHNRGRVLTIVHEALKGK